MSSTKSSEIEEFKTYHNNGKLFEHYYRINGKRHGEYKSFYDNANPYEHCFHKDDKYHGEFKWYRESGEIIEHCFFNNNDREELSDYIDDINNITDSEFMNLSMIFGNSFIAFASYIETAS